MSFVDFKSSGIPAKFSLEVQEKTVGQTLIAPEYVEPLFKMLLSGIANLCKLVFNKDKASAVVIDDLKGNPMLSFIVKYYEAAEADDEDTGNMIFEISFDPEDVKDCMKYFLSEAKNHRPIMDAGAACGIKFTDPTGIYLSLTCMVNSIKNHLEENASEADTYEVEIEDYLKASVTVIDGVKVFSMTPHGAFKRILKKDTVKQK